MVMYVLFFAAKIKLFVGDMHKFLPFAGGKYLI